MKEPEKTTIGGLPIKIIRKKDIKNIYIRVYPPHGEVTVNTPTSVTDEEITLFVLKKLSEIESIRQKISLQNRQSYREYISGETHYLWGKGYMLQVIYNGKHHKIIKTPTKIIMIIPQGTPLEVRRKILTKWYRLELKKILPVFVLKCEQRTGIHANEFKIRSMKTHWGTCNIEKRSIQINLQLVKKPTECLEYVIIHELIHLLEKKHSHRFNALMEQFYPTWREVKKFLSDFPLDPIEKTVD